MFCRKKQGDSSLFALRSSLSQVPDMPFLANLALVCPIPLRHNLRVQLQVFAGIVLRLISHLRLPSMRAFTSPVFRIGTERRHLIMVMVALFAPHRHYLLSPYRPSSPPYTPYSLAPCHRLRNEGSLPRLSPAYPFA